MTMACHRIDPAYSYTDASACDDASDTETSAPISWRRNVVGTLESAGTPGPGDNKLYRPFKGFQPPVRHYLNHKQLQHHASNIFIAVCAQHISFQLASAVMTRQYDVPRRCLILDHRLDAIAPPMLS